MCLAILHWVVHLVHIPFHPDHWHAMEFDAALALLRVNAACLRTTGATVAPEHRNNTTVAVEPQQMPVLDKLVMASGVRQTEPSQTATPQGSVVPLGQTTAVCGCVHHAWSKATRSVPQSTSVYVPLRSTLYHLCSPNGTSHCYLPTKQKRKHPQLWSFGSA